MSFDCSPHSMWGSYFETYLLVSLYSCLHKTTLVHLTQCEVVILRPNKNNVSRDLVSCSPHSMWGSYFETKIYGIKLGQQIASNVLEYIKDHPLG